MTHAGEFLRRFCESSGIDQREIAVKAKISEGHLSKILKGDRKQIREGTLGGILEALPETQRGKFLRAYLLDVTPEDYHGFITNGITTDRVEEEAFSGESDDSFPQLRATLRRTFRPPKRKQIVSMLERLTESCAASPDFLRGVELLAKLKIK